MKKNCLLIVILVISLGSASAQKSKHSIFKNSTSPKDSMQLVDMQGNIIGYKVTKEKPTKATGIKSLKDTVEISDTKGNYYYKIGKMNSKEDSIYIHFKWSDSMMKAMSEPK